MNYRSDIDGLRAFAVMPVILYHFGVHELSGGFTGVDVFFVISGYLIAGTLFLDLQKDRFSIIAFYWRRFRRILPALVAVLIVSYIMAYFVMPSKDFEGYAWSVLSSLTFWSNMYFWQNTGYFGPSAVMTPLLHTWSLAVEEQYYIFAPLVLLITFKYLKARWLLVLFPVGLLSFALSVYGTSAFPSATFYSLPTRAWELILGAGLMLCPPRLFRSKVMIELVGILGLALLAIGYTTLTKDSIFPGIAALYPCLGAALLIYAGAHAAQGHTSLATRLLMFKPFVWLGLISYSLYLVHWPLISFATQITLLPVNEPLLMTAISIILAGAMWWGIEQPFRTNPVMRTKQFTFAFAGGSLALLGGLSVAIVNLDGMPERDANYRKTEVDVTHWRNGTCFFLPTEDIANFDQTACVHDLGYDQTRILLWGDSFAAQLVSGLEGNAHELGSNVLQMTYSGCPPILAYYSVNKPACTVFNQQAFEMIRDGQFDVVLLTARWIIHKETTLSPIHETLQALADTDALVVVIGQSPEFVDDVQRIAHHARANGIQELVWPVDYRQNTRNLLADASEQAGFPFIDPIDILCDDQKCTFADENGFYFFDFGHMTVPGATTAISGYLAELGIEDESLLSFAASRE